jgi:hypothetical protein
MAPEKNQGRTTMIRSLALGLFTLFLTGCIWGDADPVEERSAGIYAL